MIARIRAAVTRVTLVPLLVRGGVFLSVLLAYVCAYPVELLTGRALPLLVAVAALPAVAPRGRATTFAVLTGVAGWLVDTTGYGRPVVLWRLLGLAGFLYLAHVLAALAAALPYDAVVAPGVVARWVARAVGVVLASAVLAVLLLGLPADGGRLVIGVTLAGLAVSVVVAALLAGLPRRR